MSADECARRLTAATPVRLLFEDSPSARLVAAVENAYPGSAGDWVDGSRTYVARRTVRSSPTLSRRPRRQTTKVGYSIDRTAAWPGSGFGAMPRSSYPLSKLPMSTRRTFVGQIGAAAVAGVLDVDELRAAQTSMQSTWDTAWIDQLVA